MLVLVDFQDKLIQCKLPDYILDILSRIIIWKLSKLFWFTSNSQILGMEIHGVNKDLARISEEKQKDVIHTRKDQKVQIREKIS